MKLAQSLAVGKAKADEKRAAGEAREQLLKAAAEVREQASAKVKDKAKGKRKQAGGCNMSVCGWVWCVLLAFLVNSQLPG